MDEQVVVHLSDKENALISELVTLWKKCETIENKLTFYGNTNKSYWGELSQLKKQIRYLETQLLVRLQGANEKLHDFRRRVDQWFIWGSIWPWGPA